MDREKILMKASYVSLYGNLILALAKIIVGFISGSLAVVGDGVDSSVDVIISIVGIYTVRIISKAPTVKFAYGYEKADSIAAKVLSFLIFFAGAQLAVSSVQRFFGQAPLEVPGIEAIFVTVFSIISKFILSLYLLRKGKKTNSAMLLANSKNMRYDVIISFTVLLGLFFTFVLKMPILDAVFAFLVSLWVIKAAISIFIETNTMLMDGVEDADKIYKKIFDAVDKVEGAYNPHRVRTRQIGTMYMINIDIEVDGNFTLYKAHEIAHQVEDHIRQDLTNIFDIVIHIDPKDHHENEMDKGIWREQINPK